MSAYESLARSYDRLTNDISYPEIADFIESVLQQTDCRPKTVLDLACGTGSLSLELSRRGYQVIGADISEDMLIQASEKACKEKNRPFFICQPMQELELPEPVDLIVCCLDSLNYLTEPADLRQTFQRAYASLRDGGAMVFDINTPQKLTGLDGQIFLDEDDDVYCVWRAEFSKEENILTYGMDLFQRVGNYWQRSFEEHLEYAYAPEDLKKWLYEAGFCSIEQFADKKLEKPAKEEQRIYFLARKGEKDEGLSCSGDE